MKKIGLLIFVLISSLSHAQTRLTNLERINIEGVYVPKVTVANLNALVNMTLSQWDVAMADFSFYDKGVSNNCNYYTTSTMIKDKMYGCSRCDGGKIIISWDVFDYSNYYLMQELQEIIEPNYVGKDANGSLYDIKILEKNYLIKLSRNKTQEIVSITKKQ